MKLFDYLREKKELKEGELNIELENTQMKKKVKAHKKFLAELQKEKDAIQQKYIAILEEKGEGFNQYLRWQEKVKEVEADERELRKEIVDLKKDLNNFSDIIGKLFLKKEITSLNKCESYEDFLSYVLRLYYKDKTLPLKGISETCKKLGITKAMIQKDSEYLYKILNVKKWDIE